MEKRKLLVVSKWNTDNGNLVQMLHRAFILETCSGINEAVVESARTVMPDVILVSLIDSSFDYRETFELLKRECANIPVITLGSESESQVYAEYYKEKQIHKILRPISGNKLLEQCNAVIRTGKTIEREESKEESTMKTVTGKNEKPHVLVVDDNAMILRNVKSILEGKYSVAVAASGSQALVSIGKKKPDLILLDYEMPVMNGEAVMEMLQAEEELKDIPVLFLTSVASKEVVMKLLALKPAGYILKPAERETLMKTIEETLGK